MRFETNTITSPHVTNLSRHSQDIKSEPELTLEERLQALKDIRSVTLDANDFNLSTEAKKNLTIVINTLEYIANNAERINQREGKARIIFLPDLKDATEENYCFISLENTDNKKSTNYSVPQGSKGVNIMLHSWVDAFIHAFKKAQACGKNEIQTLCSHLYGQCIDARISTAISYGYSLKNPESFSYQLTKCLSSLPLSAQYSYFETFNAILNNYWGKNYFADNKTIEDKSLVNYPYATKNGCFDENSFPLIARFLQDKGLKANNGFLSTFFYVKQELQITFIKFVLSHQNLLTDTGLPEKKDNELSNDELTQRAFHNMVGQLNWEKLINKSSDFIYLHTLSKRASLLTFIPIFKNIFEGEINQAHINNYSELINNYLTRLKASKAVYPAVFNGLININFYKGNTLLHILARYSMDTHLIKTALELGIDPTKENDDKQTPLTTAILSQNISAIEVLCDKDFKAPLKAQLKYIDPKNKAVFDFFHTLPIQKQVAREYFAEGDVNNAGIIYKKLYLDNKNEFFDFKDITQNETLTCEESEKIAAAFFINAFEEICKKNDFELFKNLLIWMGRYTSIAMAISDDETGNTLLHIAVKSLSPNQPFTQNILEQLINSDKTLANTANLAQEIPLNTSLAYQTIPTIQLISSHSTLSAKTKPLIISATENENVSYEVFNWVLENKNTDINVRWLNISGLEHALINHNIEKIKRLLLKHETIISGACLSILLEMKDDKQTQDIRELFLTPQIINRLFICTTFPTNPTIKISSSQKVKNLTHYNFNPDDEISVIFHFLYKYAKNYLINYINKQNYSPSQTKVFHLSILKACAMDISLNNDLPFLEFLLNPVCNIKNSDKDEGYYIDPNLLNEMMTSAIYNKQTTHLAILYKYGAIITSSYLKLALNEKAWDAASWLIDNINLNVEETTDIASLLPNVPVNIFNQFKKLVSFDELISSRSPTHAAHLKTILKELLFLAIKNNDLELTHKLLARALYFAQFDNTLHVREQALKFAIENTSTTVNTLKSLLEIIIPPYNLLELAVTRHSIKATAIFNKIYNGQNYVSKISSNTNDQIFNQNINNPGIPILACRYNLVKLIASYELKQNTKSTASRFFSSTSNTLMIAKTLDTMLQKEDSNILNFIATHPTTNSQLLTIYNTLTLLYKPIAVIAAPVTSANNNIQILKQL